MAAPYYDMIEEVCVMLVDPDKDFVNEMVDLLKSYEYKVTTVDMASAAMLMLSEGKKKIDVMIINVNLLDIPSFQLLDQVVALDIVSLCVCDEHNPLLVKKAFDSGAYLCLKKALHLKILKYLWQFVLRKKIQKEKAREKLEEKGNQVNVIGDADDIHNNNIIEDEEQVGEKNVPYTEERRNNIHETENNIASNEKDKLRRKRDRTYTKENNEGKSQSNANKAIDQKVCTEWTVDLHTKFMEAVQYLGEGRCYPRDILEVMNVLGLTRMQVASHLQKCRTNNWKAPKKQKYICHLLGQGSSSDSRKRNSFNKFGTMPHLQTNILDLHQQQRNPNQTQRGPEFSFPPHRANDSFAREDRSTQQQLYRPQLQVQPHYLSTGSLFNNLFLSDQNNTGGGLQQKYGSLFEMLGSQGLQGSNIESTNYRPELALNSGDHHTQNDYNLDLNVPYVTTYSGSTIMSDTYIKNATSNEFGEANANFPQYIGEPNLSDPSNIVASSHESDTEERNSNVRENCDTSFDFNNMDYIFQNLGPPGADLPDE